MDRLFRDAVTEGELVDVFSAIEEWTVSQYIAYHPWLFPAIEVVHVLALTIVVGSIMMVDTRLLGLANRSKTVGMIASESLPFTWAAFVMAVASGAMMFISSASRYAENGYFVAKMGLLLLAGLNMLTFHYVTGRGFASWVEGREPVSAKVAGGLSLFFWIVIVICGRWVGFT